MPLPNEVDSGSYIVGTHPPVILQKVNQDNFGVTYSLRDQAGKEYQLQVKRRTETPKGSRSRRRHIVDGTFTEFDATGAAIVWQTYVHIVVPRGTSLDNAQFLAQLVCGFCINYIDNLLGDQT